MRVLGSSAKLERTIGVITPVFVSQMRSGVRAIPPKHCIKLELATQRVVTRARLRADVIDPLGGQINDEVQQES
ncbi:transcriptional regulator [Microbulbifer okhotskensis]|uniref:transcriptional regulator n=1 Tax=Microbulbifer okhotskensis TaxID=2926617 RepID=UPI00359C8DF0